MNQRFVRVSVAAVLAAGLVATAAHAADGRYRDYVIGDRASGMGGAGLAISRSVDAIYYNPAGLTESKHDSLSLSANLYGFESFRQRNALYPGEDASSSSFVTIPTAVGGVRRFSDNWVGGFGVFTPEDDRMDLIVSKANGNHLYTVNGTDQTLWFGPAVGWTPDSESPWSFGAAVFGVYRSMQATMNIYHEESGLMGQAYDVDDFGVLASLGAQYDFGAGWRAGATLQTPNLHVYGDGKASYAVIGVRDERANSFRAFSDDLDTDNRGALQLGLGIGRYLPGQYAYGLDVTYHPSSSYDMMEWTFKNMGSSSSHVKMNDVVDCSLGGELYVAEHWPVRAGFYTAFSGVDVPDPNSDELLDTDMDLFGFTFSVGRETETMGINVGLEYAFGHGHTLGYTHLEGDEAEQGVTTCRKELILVSLSTTYYF